MQLTVMANKATVMSSAGMLISLSLILNDLIESQEQQLYADSPGWDLGRLNWFMSTFNGFEKEQDAKLPQR